MYGGEQGGSVCFEAGKSKWYQLRSKKKCISHRGGGDLHSAQGGGGEKALKKEIKGRRL